jgi:hypothetical protein
MLSKHEEQAERRDVIENEKRLRASTLSQFAQSDADIDRGRFTVHEQSRVIGSSPSPASQYPAGPAWTTDPGSQCIEPPLSPHDNPALEPSDPEQSFSLSQDALATPSPSSLQAPPLANEGLGFSQRAYRRF